MKQEEIDEVVILLRDQIRITICVNGSSPGQHAERRLAAPRNVFAWPSRTNPLILELYKVSGPSTLAPTKIDMSYI